MNFIFCVSHFVVIILVKFILSKLNLCEIRTALFVIFGFVSCFSDKGN